MDTRALHVLVVDDDALFVASLATHLAQLQAPAPRLWPAATVAQALTVLARRPVDVVLLDVHLAGGVDGLDALPQLRAAAPATPVVVHSVAADADTVVRAMRQGALDYVPKHLGAAALKQCLAQLVRQAARAVPSDGMVGTAPALQALRAALQVAQRSNGNVLIYGESGSGKELVARALARTGAPFVAVDAATLEGSLAGAALFGHERGAYTGAVQAGPGLFERADGGVLYLDEVANLDLQVQAKLLRVLQERQVVRLGGSKVRTLQFRCVAATHADLPALCRAGRFRADLLARLNVFCLRVPPLRRRRQDVAALFAHFVRRYGGAPHWDAAVAHWLATQPFFGNVRELAAAAEVAVAHADGAATLQLRHLPAAWPACSAEASPEDWTEDRTDPGDDAPAPGASLPPLPPPLAQLQPEAAPDDAADDGGFYAQVRAFERRTLMQAFAAYRGNISAMARGLHMDRSSLYAKLRTYAIHLPCGLKTPAT